MSDKAIAFEFTSYKFEPDKKRIFFNYKTEFEKRSPLFFTETLILPQKPDIKHIPKKLISKMLEGLHIILGVSYYKLYCATKARLPYRLTKKEADFWNIVYKNGLGEFFYRNNLDPQFSPKFLHKKSHKVTSFKLQITSPKCLVGVGGGKDSIVSLELLKSNNFDINTLFVETNRGSELIDKIIKISGVKNLKVKRFLDKKVFQQHKYSGHIPISAIYAFIGVFTAVLYKYSHFIVGNEYGSNFGNLIYKGKIINHQWSKSFEFEKLFQDYLKDISPDIGYFSLLRPFYEIRIAKLFSGHKKYFSRFSSCNRNFSLAKTNKRLWCNQCPKCVFVFILLSAFLSKKELTGIFGKNLYEEKKLLPLFKDVLGLGKMKPFDCVGTFEETQTSLFLARKRFGRDFIVRQVANKAKYSKEVLRVQKESSVPEKFKFLGMENILILGYGREGKTTEKYLKKYHPWLKIGIADKKQGSNYLEKQKNYDVAVKTPGIRKELVEIPYTTATNIFFSKVKGKNTIIGVTGSKGKSTTASLISEILKAGNKDVELLGNIGKPMLERLLKHIPKKKIFVLELSSYQLDDIKFSPDIAVVTNLFPEHMDYHKTVKNYYEAKKNIINFQSENNYFIYNSKNNIVKGWLKDYSGKSIGFKRSNIESSLAGEHNQENIGAAVSVARIFKIPDKTIKRAIENFKALPHRLEFVGQFKGIKFYDDAISTTPESTIMAIKSLKKIGTILLGGKDRGYDFSKLEKTIKKYKIKNIVLFPESGPRMIKSKKGLNLLKTSDMKKAVEFSYKNTKKGDICLLSCASPSYSLWKDFEEKGDQFQYFVKKPS